MTIETAMPRQTERLRLTPEQAVFFASDGSPVLSFCQEGVRYKGALLDAPGLDYDCFMAIMRAAGSPMPITPEESSDDD